MVVAYVIDDTDSQPTRTSSLIPQPQIDITTVYLRDLPVWYSDVVVFKFSSDSPLVSVMQTVGAMASAKIVFYNNAGDMFPSGVFSDDDELSPLSMLARPQSDGNRAICVSFHMSLQQTRNVSTKFPGIPIVVLIQTTRILKLVIKL